jgi:hypothetical protein
MRTYDGASSMMVEARCVSSAQAQAGMADVSAWGGTLSSAVGGHLLYGPFTVARGGGVLTLDASMPYRDRVLLLNMTMAAPQDIRPGTALGHLIFPAGSVGLGWKAETFYTANGHDGLAGTPRGGANRYNYANPINYATGNTDPLYVLFADQATGQLIFKNNDPANDIFGTLMIFASEETGRIVAVP